MRPPVLAGVSLIALLSLTGCNEIYDTVNACNYDGVDELARDLDLASLGGVACDWHTQSAITTVAAHDFVIEGADYATLASRLRDEGFELSAEEDLSRSNAWRRDDGPFLVHVFVFDESRMIGDSAKGCRTDGAGIYVQVTAYTFVDE